MGLDEFKDYVECEFPYLLDGIDGSLLVYDYICVLCERVGFPKPSQYEKVSVSLLALAHHLKAMPEGQVAFLKGKYTAPKPSEPSDNTRDEVLWFMVFGLAIALFYFEILI